MAHEIELEHTDKRLNKREEVRYHRRRAAWFLASKLGDVTQESYDKAFDLLKRCTLWAIKQMRHDESETSENHKAYWYVHEGELLYRRMERLDAELRPYGCKIACLGYFCENVYDYDFDNNVITNEKCNHYLHFFD